MVKTADMTEEAKKRYVLYALEVNEDRAIQCVIDGLKPVQRRILWAMFKEGFHHKGGLHKAAKVIGLVLGNYHPHSDSALYDAMVTVAKKIPVPMVYGSGNWGNFLGDKAAAYRYTECKLSAYSDIVFFDPFYNPVVKTVLNYNDEEDYREPVTLNALIPNALINPVGGIGVGVSVDMPSFTYKSVIDLAIKTLKNQGKCTPKMCAKYLVFTNKLNGIPIISEEEKLELFETGKGRVQFDSHYDVDYKKRTAIIHTRFADVNMPSSIEKTLLDPRVKMCSDIPNKKEQTFEIYIELKSSVKSDEIKSVFRQIVEKYFSNTESYEISTTYRWTDDGDTAEKELKACNTATLISEWASYRIQLEVEACTYWIDRVQKEIDQRKLLIKAVDQLEVIITALRQKFTKDQLRTYIAKHMKLTEEEAEVIIQLRVYQLRKLEREQLLAEIKEREQTIAGYKQRIKEPAPYIIEQLGKIEKQLDGFVRKFG